MKSCWLWFIGGYQSSGHVGHFDQNCPNLVRMPWMNFQTGGVVIHQMRHETLLKVQNHHLNLLKEGGLSLGVFQKGKIWWFPVNRDSFLVNGLTWSCSSFSPPKHSLSLGFIRTSTLNHQAWTNQQKPWNKKQLPAPSKGCQMVPKGFQFTIP